MTEKSAPKAPWEDPRAVIGALDDEELAKVKVVILGEYANCLSIKDAGEACGLSVREVHVLRQDDPEFSKRIDSIIDSDDWELRDASRACIRDLLENGAEVTRRSLAVHVDKTRGGYGEKVRHEVSEFKPSTAPVDLERFRANQTGGKTVQPLFLVPENAGDEAEPQKVEGWE